MKKILTPAFNHISSPVLPIPDGSNAAAAVFRAWAGVETGILALVLEDDATGTLAGSWSATEIKSVEYCEKTPAFQFFG